MHEALTQRLADETIETLEKLAFLFASHDEDRQEDIEDSVSAVIDYKGPYKGRLIMVMDRECLPELAGNMLGLDDPDEVEANEHLEAYKEAINIVCGNVLPALAGRNEVFDLGSPQIIDGAAELKTELAPVESEDDPVVARLEMDEGLCDLFLFVSGGWDQIQMPSESELIEI